MCIDPSPHYDPYPWLARFYDVTARAMLAPLGGEKALRERAIDALAARSGARVLELGCGTGAMTARLVARGHDVTALDLSDAMLQRARRKAPRARILKSSMTTFDEGPTFDRVLVSFVLHELPLPILDDTLATARRALNENGRLVVVDFAQPPSALLRRGLHLYLRATEPKEARALVRRGIEQTVEEHAFIVEDTVPLALGTARAVRARVRA